MALLTLIFLLYRGRDLVQYVSGNVFGHPDLSAVKADWVRGWKWEYNSYCLYVATFFLYKYYFVLNANLNWNPKKT